MGLVRNQIALDSSQVSVDLPSPFGTHVNDGDRKESQVFPYHYNGPFCC